MLTRTKNIADQTILDLIAESNPEGWNLLHKKYAATIYGIIHNLTGKRALTEEIFKETFLQVKETRFILLPPYALCPFLIRHTLFVAGQKLREWEITSSKGLLPENKLTKIVSLHHIPLKELPSPYTLAEEEAKRKPDLEFSTLRADN